MIHANQLRIGNWVEFRPENYLVHNNQRAVQVSEINSQIISTIDKNHTLALSASDHELQPICITPEILEKAGFEFHTHRMAGDCWRVLIMKSAERYLSLVRFGKSGFLALVAEPNNEVALHPLYSLHELQNLYFALTGQELTVNL